MAAPEVVGPADIVARTIIGEARGGGIPGMTAIACVIMNRTTRGGWWGDTPTTVCLKPWQFSCWNDGDPNLDFITAIKVDDPLYRTALLIAQAAIAGKLRDVTNGATSYYAASMKHPPTWSHGRTPCSESCGHIFFRG